MKKILMISVALLAVSFVTAQDMKFGVKAGFFTTSYDAYSLHSDYYRGNYLGINDPNAPYSIGRGNGSNVSNFGVYIGGLVDFLLVDDFRIQPELMISIDPNKDLGYVALNIPVLVKYPFFPKFYAMAGPAFNYAVGGDNEQFSPSFDLGASYDVMEDFYVELRGDIGLSGYLGSTLNAGVGYRF